MVAGLLAVAGCAAAGAQVSLTTVVEMAQRNSTSVREAQADVNRAAAQWSEARDVFIPSISFGSGLPAFPEVGFTGSLPSIWDANLQSMVFSLPQIRYVQAAHVAMQAAQLSLKDAREQVALDASSAYIELDTVDRELAAAQQQEDDAARMVAIEEQRAEAGVDPLIDLLQAKLSAAQLNLNHLHLETRADTAARQLSVLTGLPAASILPDHSSIPEVPAITGDQAPRPLAGVQAAQLLAASKARVAKGDKEHLWLLPEVEFGAIYNRNTTVLNNINYYYYRPIPANDFSSGFSIRVPIFDAFLHAKARESAAEALRARVEAEQAQRQSDLQVAEISSSLRELDARAEVASLEQQIADEQLKSVRTQLELGNGAGNGPGAPPQLSPEAAQQAMIDERQKYENALEAGLELNKARLNLLRALGHMQDWLNELHTR